MKKRLLQLSINDENTNNLNGFITVAILQKRKQQTLNRRYPKGK